LQVGNCDSTQQADRCLRHLCRPEDAACPVAPVGTLKISGRQKAGYILGLIVGFTNIPGAFVPGGDTESGAPTGPPVEILAFGVVAGGLIMALLALAWRTGRRPLVRVAAVLMILVALTAIPAFFIDTVPAWVKLFAGAYVLATLASLVLLFSPSRRPVAVPD
jgi:hypothetical protein